MQIVYKKNLLQGENKMKKNILTFLALAAILSLLLVSCAKVEEAAPAEEAAPVEEEAAPAEEEAAPAEEEAAEEKTLIAYMPQNTGNPYFERILVGFEKACEELGTCEILYTAPATTGATDQIPFIEEAVQKGIDVLCIQSNSQDALNTVLDDVRAKGILVFTNNSDITDNESHRDASVLNVNLAETGDDLLEEIAAVMDYKGKFAIVSATVDAPAQLVWMESINDLLENDPKYAEMELLEVAYGDDLPEKTLTETEALLVKYPDIEGILAITAVAGPIVGQVLEQQGIYPGGPNAKDGGVFGVGTCLPSMCKDYVMNGVMPNVLLWDPADAGYASVYLAMGVLDETIKIEPDACFDIPGKPQECFDEKLLIYAADPFVFTPENIEQFNF